MPTTASPFRYPGGKTQLYKFVRNLLKGNTIKGTYIEPFAGGAGVAIKLLVNNEIDKVWINDYDKSIYAVWHAILTSPSALIDKINNVPFDYLSGSKFSDEYNLEYWKQQKEIYLMEKNHQNSLDNAFATLFLNRTNVSGIITGGPLGGTSQRNTKLYARFNKKTLIGKINSIYALKDRITLTRMDVSDLLVRMRPLVSKDNTFIFFDPPYYTQGKDLYFSSFDEEKHESLANEIINLKDWNWITTYDKTPQISEYYCSAKQRFEYDIRYSANNKKRGHAPELMFASPDLKIESFDSVNLSRI